MTNPFNQLPDNVLDALRRGNTIEAIKLLRQSTGLGLAEAKGTIDAYRRSQTGQKPSAGNEATPDSLEQLVMQALGKGNKIEAIKLLRMRTGKGLKEATEAVEAIQASQAPKQSVPVALNGLAPGEMPRTSGSGWWIAILIAAVLAGYYFFGKAS